jgi:hypothetical protein
MSQKYKWFITDLQDFPGSLHTLEAAHYNDTEAEAINEAFHFYDYWLPKVNIFSVRFSTVETN